MNQLLWIWVFSETIQPDGEKQPTSEKWNHMETVMWRRLLRLNQGEFRAKLSMSWIYPEKKGLKEVLLQQPQDPEKPISEPLMPGSSVHRKSFSLLIGKKY